MNKALEILKKIEKMDGLAIIAKYESDEAIAELKKAMKPKSCEGCKFDKGENEMSNECYMCSRNVQDQYEPKEQL